MPDIEISDGTFFANPVIDINVMLVKDDRVNIYSNY
jgi:hypothetical protein